MKAEAKYILIAVYMIISLITFGHAYTRQTTYVVRFDGSHKEADVVEKWFPAFVASIAWPYYWSIEAWKINP
jgi:hypothetical protein